MTATAEFSVYTRNAAKRTLARAALAVLCLIATATRLEAKAYTALAGESTLTYHMIHKLHAFSGVSQKFRCIVDLPDDTLKTRIFVKAALAEFNSGNSSRDGNMVTVTNAAKYPFVEFVSDSVRKDAGRATQAAGLGKPGQGLWHVYGQLTFHGIKKPVDFLVRSDVGDGKARIRGEFDISLTAFNIERPSLLLVPVEDALRISLDVVAAAP